MAKRMLIIERTNHYSRFVYLHRLNIAGNLWCLSSLFYAKIIFDGKTDKFYRNSKCVTEQTELLKIERTHRPKLFDNSIFCDSISFLADEFGCFDLNWNEEKELQMSQGKKRNPVSLSTSQKSAIWFHSPRHRKAQSGFTLHVTEKRNLVSLSTSQKSAIRFHSPRHRKAQSGFTLHVTEKRNLVSLSTSQKSAIWFHSSRHRKAQSGFTFHVIEGIIWFQFARHIKNYLKIIQSDGNINRKRTKLICIKLETSIP
ncbi:hypothetical protein QQG55_12170 [Brugia pahangi]